MDVVIPVAEEVANPTLLYALRSIRRHAPNLRVVIVGFTMPYVSPYLPAPEGADLAYPTHQDPDDPIGNTDEAMRLACVTGEVSDPFVWGNDDVYWRRPVSLAELMRVSATALGQFEAVTVRSMAASPRPRGRYERMNAVTRDLLLSRGLPTFNYERHAPMLVDKALMLRALEMGGSKRSVYGNLAREMPEAVMRDTKLWRQTDPMLPVEVEPFVSTGNGFPVAYLADMLGWGSAAEHS